MLDAAQHERPREQRADALGHLDRLALVVQVLDQDGELVAAEAGNGVSRAQRLLQPRRDAGEQLVAGRVTEAVVDQLEVVDVAEQHRGERAAPARLQQRVSEPVAEQRPVREQRERVVQRPAAHLVLGRAPVDRLGQHVGERLDEVDVLLAEHLEPAASGARARRTAARARR